MSLILFLDILGPLLFTICIILMAYDIRNLKLKQINQETDIFFLKEDLKQITKKLWREQ